MSPQGSPFWAAASAGLSGFLAAHRRERISSTHLLAFSLNSFEVETGDGNVGDGFQDLAAGQGPFHLIGPGVGFLLGIHQEEDDLPGVFPPHVLERRPDIPHRVQPVDGPPQAQVIRRTPVDQVDVWPLLRIQVGKKYLGLLGSPPGDGISLQGLFHPFGRMIVAGPGVVVEGNGSQETRNGRRRGHRAGYGETGQVGTDEVEHVLGEGKVGSQGQVGGVDQDEGPPLGQDVAEGFPLEQVLIIVFGGQIAAPEFAGRKPEPVPHVHGLPDQVLLDIFLEEPGFKVLKDPRAKKAVVSRRETAAGDGRDGVDFIQQRPFPTLQGNFRLGELLHDPVGQGRGPRPAPGKSEDQQQLVGTVGPLRVFEPVAALRGNLGQKVVRGIMGAAQGKKSNKEETEPGKPMDHALFHSAVRTSVIV
jgi:hypothetical protein